MNKNQEDDDFDYRVKILLVGRRIKILIKLLSNLFVFR